MSKSLEALDNLIIKTGIINDTCASLKDCIKCGKCKFEEPVEICDDYNLIMTIKQDLERKEQLEIADRNNQNLVKTNVDLVNKNLELQKENQELIVNKNVAQAVALNQKREIGELKDKIAYLQEEFEGWQSAYEWSQAQNSILKLKNQELKEIIKENFFYHKNSEEIGYRKPMPKYQDKIKEVLGDE